MAVRVPWSDGDVTVPVPPGSGLPSVVTRPESGEVVPAVCANADTARARPIMSNTATRENLISSSFKCCCCNAVTLFQCTPGAERTCRHKVKQGKHFLRSSQRARPVTIQKFVLRNPRVESYAEEAGKWKHQFWQLARHLAIANSMRLRRLDAQSLALVFFVFAVVPLE